MKKLLFILIAVLPCALNAQNYLLTYTPNPGEAMGLENAIRLGIENNTELLRIRQNILITEQKVKENTFFRYPQISLLATASVYNLETPMVLPEDLGLRLLTPDAYKSDTFYGAGITATQYLYSGGRISGAIELSKANLKEEQSRYDTVKNNVILEVKTAFYTLLYAQLALKDAQEFYDKAAALHKKIDSKTWDSVSADAAFERARKNLNAAKTDEQTARLAMTKAVNRELNSPVNILGDLTPEVFDHNLNTLKLRAMENRPEMRAAIYEVAAQDININLTSAKTYPDVILSASFERVGEDGLTDTNTQASVAVRLPISYSLTSLAKQKKARQKESYLKRSSMEDNINVQVAENFDNCSFWSSEVWEREGAYEKLKTKFSQAAKSASVSLSALNALEELYKTRVSYLEAVKENKVAKVRLEWAIGQDL